MRPPPQIGTKAANRRGRTSKSVCRIRVWPHELSRMRCGPIRSPVALKRAGYRALCQSRLRSLPTLCSAFWRNSRSWRYLANRSVYGSVLSFGYLRLGTHEQDPKAPCRGSSPGCLEYINNPDRAQCAALSCTAYHRRPRQGRLWLHWRRLRRKRPISIQARISRHRSKRSTPYYSWVTPVGTCCKGCTAVAQCGIRAPKPILLR